MHANPSHPTENAGSTAEQSTGPVIHQSAAKRPGRPTLLTEQLVQLLRHLIAEYGMSDSAAAARAGIAPSTLSRWKAEHDGLEEDLAIAREEFRIQQIDEIRSATTKDGRRDWRAAAWLLEKVFPQDYGRRATTPAPTPLPPPPQHEESAAPAPAAAPQTAAPSPAPSSSSSSSSSSSNSAQQPMASSTSNTPAPVCNEEHEELLAQPFQNSQNPATPAPASPAHITDSLFVTAPNPFQNFRNPPAMPKPLTGGITPQAA